MSGLYRDEGVVLRTIKLGEADRIVTLLSLGHGKVRAVAKGIRKTTSKFGARLEPTSRVAFQCYRGRELDVVTQVETMEANRHLREETDAKKRRHMHRSRAINAFGLFMTAAVLVVVLATKFFAGAWIAILAMVAIFLLMKSIEQHYLNVARELAIDVTDQTLPARVHAIVLVGRLQKPTLRALAYARVSRPNTLEGLYVGFDKASADAMRERWDELGLPVPLKIISSPYRELVRPILRYVKEVRTGNPRDIVTVYIPEYVVGHWWEHLLHNQTALRLKGRLLFMPGVMVTSVPYQLRSVARAKEKAARTGVDDH